MTSTENVMTAAPAAIIAPLLVFAPIRLLGSSQVDDDVSNRSRTANEQVAVCGPVERFRLIGDRARNQTALAVMADTGPARPADRDGTRLGQLQNALVGCRVPVCSDAAARERHQRTGFGVVLGRMWSPRGCADDTGSQRLAATEDLEI